MSYVPQESGEALLLADRITPRLSHSNSAVVLTCIRVVLYLMNYIADENQITSLSRKLSPPLVTLLAKGPEVQYLALRNALLILQRRPEVLKNDIRVFFCKYNDPIYVKVTKLELIFMLATEENMAEVLAELKECVQHLAHREMTNCTKICNGNRCTLCEKISPSDWKTSNQDRKFRRGLYLMLAGTRVYES